MIRQPVGSVRVRFRARCLDRQHFPDHPVHATSGIRSIRKWLCSLARAAVNSDLGSPCCKLQGYCNRVARVGGCKRRRGRGDKGAFTSSAADARVWLICNLPYQRLSAISFGQHRVPYAFSSRQMWIYLKPIFILAVTKWSSTDTKLISETNRSYRMENVRRKYSTIGRNSNLFERS